MIHLNTGQTVYASSTNTNVSYTLEGEEGGVDKILEHGFFYTIKNLYTAPAPAEFFVFLSNNNQPLTTEVRFYIGGQSATNLIFRCTLEANWSVSYDGDWRVYDQNGLLRIAGNPQITVSDTAPLSPSMGDLWVQL